MIAKSAFSGVEEFNPTVECREKTVFLVLDHLCDVFGIFVEFRKRLAEGFDDGRDELVQPRAARVQCLMCVADGTAKNAA